VKWNFDGRRAFPLNGTKRGSFTVAIDQGTSRGTSPLYQFLKHTY
jgi:hypothetical protein